jgi:hypothetical protein
MKSLVQIFLLLTLLLYQQAHAEVLEDDQSWINLNAFIKHGKGWHSNWEFQPRFIDHHRIQGQTIYRLAIGKDLALGFSVWLGYARIETSYPRSILEDRLFPQLFHISDLGGLRLINRTRYELRSFHGERNFSWRFRHLVRGQYRLHQHWGLIGASEWFWNSNTLKPDPDSRQGVLKEGFDQIRFFIGPGYYFGSQKQHLLETGYLHQYVNSKRDRSNSIFMTQLTVRF